jgi:hypothetical protein
VGDRRRHEDHISAQRANRHWADSVREVLPYQTLRAAALPDFQVRMDDLKKSD